MKENIINNRKAVKERVKLSLSLDVWICPV